MRVSIPFIAGQWSLRQAEERAKQEARASQSPSLRGSGRFKTGRRAPCPTWGLNPLHCGAVVASFPPPEGGGRSVCMSQSPSLRGSGRFARARRDAEARAARLNPLHCGAVVASAARRRGAGRAPWVSIPFIAGQWSLRSRAWMPSARRCASQSPSLRGSGRFAQALGFVSTSANGLNPLHCGAVVASVVRIDCAGHQQHVSIPFIAGQWSLRTRHSIQNGNKFVCLNPLHCGAVVASKAHTDAEALLKRLSQSPSLRGSGRFRRNGRSGKRRPASQSPSLRGSGRFKIRNLWGLRVEVRVSIPFIAGQWSLLK